MMTEKDLVHKATCVAQLMADQVNTLSGTEECGTVIEMALARLLGGAVYTLVGCGHAPCTIAAMARIMSQAVNYVGQVHGFRDPTESTH